MVLIDRINPSDTVREVIQRHPETREVFEEAGIRVCCHDCAIRTAALRGGLDLSSLLADLEAAALDSR
jgi:iron-sulfur cluster repair protein YtfE (RIC family)